MKSEKKYVLFGGSFDPPHVGHFLMCRFLIENDLAHQVILVPAAASPFKMENPPVNGDDRMSMLFHGIEEVIPELSDKCAVLDLELKRPPPSYTSETLQILRSISYYDDGRISLLLGADSVEGLPLWNHFAQMLSGTDVYIFQRSEFPAAEIEKKISVVLQAFEQEKENQRLSAGSGLDHSEDFDEVQPLIDPSFHILDSPLIECSSSEIRDALRAGLLKDEIRNCLPESVFEYIQEKKLYGFQS